MILAEQPDKRIILALQHETSYPACSDAIKILTRKDPTLEIELLKNFGRANIYNSVRTTWLRQKANSKMI